MATKSTSALQPNSASALCYVPFIGWIAAVVLLVVEKNQTVKWNAIQSLVLMAAVWAVALILVIIAPMIWVGGFILQLVLAVKAFQGETMKLPVIGKAVDRIAGKI